MKKIILFLGMLFLSTVNQNSYGQGIWNPQTNPTTNSGESMQFVSDNEGWITLNSSSLLHTTNAGANWTVVTPEPNETSFGIDAPGSRLSFVNSKTGWVLKNKTNPDAGVSTAGVVLYNTTDGGATWQKKMLSTVAGEAGIQVQFTDASHGWVLIFNMTNSTGYFLRTTDGGTTWKPAEGRGIFQFLDNNVGYAFTGSGEMGTSAPYYIFKTVDGGYNWTNSYIDNSTGELEALHFSDTNNGWVVGRNGKILKTSDGGQTWSAITNTGLTSSDKNNNVFFVNPITGWISTKLNSGSNVLLYTGDGGLTWSQQTSPSLNYKVFSMYFTNPTNGWAAIDGGNIMHYSAPITGNYSNATLNGPWLFYKNVSPIDPYNNNLAYFIFDGKGNITGFNGFGIGSGNYGTYTVYPNGQFSGSLNIDSQTYPLGGTLTSQTEGNMTADNQSFLLHKVSNPGALSKRISGTLTTNPNSDCGNRTVTFDINSNGEVIASTGLSGTVTGNVYTDLGVFIGHFKSTDTQHGWNEFSIFGYYSNNYLIGKTSVDAGHEPGSCNENTSASLVRTDNLAIDDFVNSTKKVVFYPNPSEGNFNFYIQEPKAKLEISIFNFLGQKVFETINTDMKNDNKIEFEPKAKGMYLIKIYDGEKEYSEKMLVK